MHVHLRTELLPRDDHPINPTAPVPRIVDDLAVLPFYQAQNLQATVIKTKYVDILGWILVEYQGFWDDISFRAMPSGVNCLEFAGARVKIPYLKAFIASTGCDTSE